MQKERVMRMYCEFRLLRFEPFLGRDVGRRWEMIMDFKRISLFSQCQLLILYHHRNHRKLLQCKNFLEFIFVCLI